MNQPIEELFKAAQPFEEGDLLLHPDYEQACVAAGILEDILMECCGGEVARLMKEYIIYKAEMMEFETFHFFRQGYLAAKSRRNKKS